jgi:transcriptional regulator with XRE-family HTH domain
MSDNRFGVWLRARRSQQGISLRTLAQSAHVGRSTLSDWETGRTLPRLSEWEQVCTALNVPAPERQELLRSMESPRALLQAQLEAWQQQPTFVEQAGHLPHGGDLLRAMRRRKHWTLAQAAQRIGVRQPTLSRWERGERFPDADTLQTVCAVYGASQAERTALVCGRSSLAQDVTEHLSLDALEHRFRTQLQPLELTAEIHPGRDLDFLRMEAALWTHALHKESVRPLLAEVYAHHGCYLRNWRQSGEVYASRCLELLPPTKRLPGFASLAVACVSDALNSRTGNRRGQASAWLTPWLSRCFPPHSLSWLLRRASGLRCERRDFAGAQHFLEQAKRLPEDRHWAFDQREIQRYQAWNLLYEGKASESLEQLPTTPETYAPNRVRDALLRAEGLLTLNKRNEAQDWLTAAYADIERYRMHHWQPNADQLSRRF